jgi:hypothetical protein
VVRILRAGAEGSLGRRITLASAEARSSTRLADRAPVDPRYRSDIEFEALVDDLGDLAYLEALCRRSFDSIFHIAVALPLKAERVGPSLPSADYVALDPP